MQYKTFFASALLVAAASATSHEVVAAPKHEAVAVAPVEAPKHEVAPPVHVAPPKHEAPVVQAAPAAGWKDAMGAKGGIYVIPVAVGDANGSLTYTPNTVHASPGDVVQFQFWPKNHTVTESSFDKPCMPKDAALATAQRPGLRSGFVPVTGQEDTTPVFNVLVNDTEPIWIFCGQQPHCRMGMAMVINPPNNPERTIEKYIEAAKALPPPPGAPAGGAPPAGVSPPAAAGTGIESAPPAASAPASGDESPVASAAGAEGSSTEPAPATFTGAASKSSTSLLGLSALAFGLAALL